MQITIDKSNSDQRFDRFLRKRCKQYPAVRLADIYSRIRKGEIKVNSKRAKEEARLQEGDIIEIDDKISLGSLKPRNPQKQKQKKIEQADKETIKKRILYEDDNWICLDKPSGIVSHPGGGEYDTLSMNDYLGLLVKADPQQTTFKPAFGYRLDKDTSGVLIGAKTYPALQYINQIIRDKKIQKYYFALVVGKFPLHLIIQKSLEKSYDKKSGKAHVIAQDTGMPARSECWNEKNVFHPLLGDLSLVKVKIETGRMHQIRVHLAGSGFPVLGDLVYGKPAANRILLREYKIKRQLLHCRKYSFYDIFSHREISLEAPLPGEFERILQEKK